MKRLALALGMLFILGFCGQAFADYSVSFMYVQRRVYEDTEKGVLNRLCFQIKDDGGNLVREDLLTSVKLFNPNNKKLKLIDRVFYDREYGMWSWYNASTGQWMYDGVVHDDSAYYFTIDAKNLIKGTYKLVLTYNGFQWTTNYDFSLVNLPLIAGSTIKTNLDSKGNLFCTWKIPNSAFYLTDQNPALAVSARAVIDVYKGETFTAYIQTTVPIHMGQVFFPARIVDQIKTLGGDTYKFRVQIRSNDQDNRTLSNYVDLSL
jgi:hypothetical protein